MYALTVATQIMEKGNGRKDDERERKRKKWK